LRERVLAIVNLIARYVLGSGDEPISEHELVSELLAEGFDRDEINDAFSWMETTAFAEATTPAIESFCAPPSAMRIFSAEETQLIDIEARGFLIRLRHMGVIDDEIEEGLIDRIYNAAEEPVSLQEIKILTALTLLARNSRQWQREVDCIMTENWMRIYH
jgi:Smg protein